MIGYMAKEKNKFTLPQCEYMDEHSDENFLLIAIPEELFVERDRLRDAVVDYIPGYDRKDFEVLRKVLDWVDNMPELLCIKDGK